MVVAVFLYGEEMQSKISDLRCATLLVMTKWRPVFTGGGTKKMRCPQ